MLKVTFLLWMLAKLIRRAIRNDPKAAAYVAGKNLTFQIRTKGGIGRHYRISKGTITSTAGGTRDAAFTMTFSSPAAGFRIRSAKDSQDAFLQGLHDRELDLSGDFVEVMWFQGLTDFLKPAR
jgi:hypothetical protein